MLTETDDRVLAAVNLHAVLGALPRLVELDAESAAILRRLDRPICLTLVVRGGPTARYRFAPDGIDETTEPAPGARLLFTSPAHANAVIAGTAQPIPVAGPRGLRFLTGVFTPLTARLGAVLRATPEELADPAAAERATLLTLDVAARAIAVVGNEDVSGRFSAAHMPDGDLDLEVGDQIRYRIEVKDHRLRVDDDLSGPPRAALRFADLTVAGGILGGTESALACVCDGRLAMRGFIPLVDNTSRILDRVGAYLEA